MRFAPRTSSETSIATNKINRHAPAEVTPGGQRSRPVGQYPGQCKPLTPRRNPHPPRVRGADAPDRLKHAPRRAPPADARCSRRPAHRRRSPVCWTGLPSHHWPPRYRLRSVMAGAVAHIFKRNRVPSVGIRGHLKCIQADLRDGRRVTRTPPQESGLRACAGPHP